MSYFTSFIYTVKTAGSLSYDLTCTFIEQIFQSSVHFSLKLLVNDLLNRAVIFKQEVPSTGEEVEVERYKKGANLEIGFSYKL